MKTQGAHLRTTYDQTNHLDRISNLSKKSGKLSSMDVLSLDEATVFYVHSTAKVNLCCLREEEYI